MKTAKIKVTNRWTGAVKIVEVAEDRVYAALNHYRTSNTKAELVLN